MQIDEHKQNRIDLAGYFVKNAIPTESNFSDLIQSGLNQRDDGITKPVGGPVSLQAVDQRGSRRVLDLYDDFSDDAPEWTLSIRSGDFDGLALSTTDSNVPLFVERKSGNVGLGTTQPAAKLDVRGGISATGIIQPAVGAQSGIRFPKDAFGGSGDEAWISYLSRGAELMTLQIGINNDPDDHINLVSSGNVGIGTDTPAFKLDVQGSIAAGTSDIYFTNTAHNHVGVADQSGWAAIENAANWGCLMILGRTTGNASNLVRNIGMFDNVHVHGQFLSDYIGALSDGRLKQDIEDSPYGLDEVRRLRPVQFNWRDRDNPHKSIGLIAQDVREVVGGLVRDDGTNLTISYFEVIPLLITAIKELDRRLSAVTPGDATR